jgi:hypothetical protein
VTTVALLVGLAVGLVGVGAGLAVWHQRREWDRLAAFRASLRSEWAAMEGARQIADTYFLTRRAMREQPARVVAIVEPAGSDR